jgi:hypothetical protein
MLPAPYRPLTDCAPQVLKKHFDKPIIQAYRYIGGQGDNFRDSGYLFSF